MKKNDFFIGKKIIVNDKMQRNYEYIIKAKMGKEANDFSQFDFFPELTPEEMLLKGIFEGKYLNDCYNEFPEEWFLNSKDNRSNNGKSGIHFNYFKIKSRMPLSYWRKKGWIIGDDPRGWFQWYCRYYLGRRTNYDEKQISRWKLYKRHVIQLRNNCEKGNLNCRPKQRQSLLQWAYNPDI